jgi:PAS domain S-box
LQNNKKVYPEIIQSRMENKDSSAQLRQRAEDFLKLQQQKGEMNDVDREAYKHIRELLDNQSVMEKKLEEHVQAEIEFYKEREYYKDIINNQPAGIYRIRVFPMDKWEGTSWASSEKPPYELELASDGFCEMLGVPREDFSKNPFILSDLVYDDDKDSFVEKNEEANKKIIPFRWEGRLLVGENIVWVRLESLPRPLENGDILWTGVLYNMTERKRAEEALRETRLRLDEVVNAAKVGISEINFQTGDVEFNNVWAQMLGYSYDELNQQLDILGKDFWKEITHPDDLQKVIDSHLKHASGKLSFIDSEVRLKHKNGHWVWLHQLGRITSRTKDGEPLIVSSIHTNISNRKKVEEELNHLNEKLEERVAKRTEELVKLNESLRQTEEKFRTVIDYTYDWEYWKSPEDTIIYMSPSVERITGYTISEFENCPDLLNRIVHKNDYELWQNHRNENSIQTPNEKNVELNFKIIRKDGEIRWISHSCRHINVDGKLIGVRVSNRDITEKVNAENQLLGVTVEVEERERNRFSRELHDGMGPLLSTIKLYFQWLSDTDDIEKKKIITEKGNHSIETAIQTARELARGLNSQHLTNSGYIIAIQDFIRQINDTNKIQIKFKTNTNTRFNSFLETTLYRITTELLKNTLTYAQASVVEIGFVYDYTKKNINFNYSDNGIGFDADKITKTYKGLGLMNIQQRVQIMKGKINIESKPGNGMKAFIQFTVEGNSNL